MIPLSVAVDGYLGTTLSVAANGYLGYQAQPVRRGGGVDDGVYHIHQNIRREFDKKKKRIEDVIEAVDFQPEVVEVAANVVESDIIIQANKQKADDILLLEYGIMSKLERYRIMSDYAMVLLLLDD